MARMGFRANTGRIVGEIEAALARVEEGQARELEEAILSARAIFTTGEGRSGLVGRCFAMRLMHLGLESHVVGETVTPAIGPDDLLLAISRSGETTLTRERAALAARHGARVAAITGAPDSPLAAAAGLVLVIPGSAEDPQAATSAQFGGSLFEQCALLCLDAIVLDLQQRLGRTDAEMRARHATLE